MNIRFSGINPAQATNATTLSANRTSEPSLKPSNNQDEFVKTQAPGAQTKNNVRFTGFFGPIPGPPPTDLQVILYLQQQIGGQVFPFEMPGQPGVHYMATKHHADIADRAITKINDGNATGNQNLINEGTMMLEELEEHLQPAANFATSRGH